MNRLEKELGSEASVVRLDVLSSVGKAAAGRYGVRGLPTFILLDDQGDPTYRQTGTVDTARVKDLVGELNERK